MQKTANGFVEEGFEPIREIFERNLNHYELGAACAIYLKGKLVVDLWGGVAEKKTNRQWQQDTMVPVFSCTKGFASLAAAVAHSKGWIDYDQPVRDIWKEFGSNGKENITMRQLLAHQAGLSTLNRLKINSLSDLDTSRMSPQLSKMEPEWEPGSRHGYHTWTIGWLIGETIRRADPQRRTLGSFLQEEIAQPLNCEFYIGLPDYVPSDRVAHIYGINNPLQLLFHLHEIPKSLFYGFLNPKSLTSRSMVDPKGFVAHDNFNKREMFSIEFPSGNGVGNARSMAKIYSEFATGGKVLNLSEATLDELKKPATPPSNGWYDLVNRTNVGYSLGFWKPIKQRILGIGANSFGHPGAGGSFCFGDPDNGVGYSYVMNKIGGYMDNNPRENEIRRVFYQCLQKG